MGVPREHDDGAPGLLRRRDGPVADRPVGRLHDPHRDRPGAPVLPVGMAIPREPVRMREGTSALVAAAPVYLFVGLLAVVPVAFLVAQGLVTSGAGGVGAVWGDPLDQQAIANSVVQGGLSALLTVAAGYPLGILLGRYEWRGRAWVRSALIVPFLLPSVVVVLGVQDLFGPTSLAARLDPGATALAHGVPGIVLVNLLFNVPIVALLTAVGVESASAPLEETVTSLGAGPARVYLKVWGPPSWRGALAGGLLTFVFSALAFAAPLLLCGPKCYTMEARVWSLVQQLLAPGAAAILAGTMVLLLLA